MLMDSLPVMFARRLLSALRTRSRTGRRLRRHWSGRVEVLEQRRVLSATPPTLSAFLTNQHVDLSIGHNFATNTWSIGPRDADEAVHYSNEDGLLYVGAPAQSVRPADAAFDFVGVPSGGTYYRLPPTQNPSVLYLGVAGYGVTPGDVDRYNPSTESKGRASGTGRWVKASLVGVDHFTPTGEPGTGKFSVWQNGDLGPVVFMSNVNDGVANANPAGLDATDGISSDDAVWVTAGGHLHYNYGFSEVGRYEVSLKLSSYFGDNGVTTPNTAGYRESETVKLYFSVRSVGRLEFDASDYSVDESAGTASVTVRRVGGSDGQITVQYATSNGSATAPDDYTNSAGTLTFLDGQTTATITVPIVDDLLEESAETVQLSLSLPGPASIADYISAPDGDNSSLLGAQTSAVLTILANDTPGNDNLAPSPLADAFVVAPGMTLSGNVLFNDSDPDGDPLTATPDSLPLHGTLVLNPSGAFTYIPGPTFAGSDSFSYIANDGQGGTASATVTVTAATSPTVSAYLTAGHADVGLALEEPAGGGDPEWNLHVHDEERDQEYAPADALLFVGPDALTSRPADPAFDFIGVAANAGYYRLPESENPELLFLGLGTEEIPPETLSGGNVTLRLKSVVGPGHFSLWRAGEVGPDVLMSTADGVTETDLVELLEASHTHVNWGFTAAGSYQVTFEAVGVLEGGQELRSGDVTYHFGVDVPIPAPPAITLSTGVSRFTENGAAVVVAPVATVTDPDSPSFPGGTLTAAITVAAHPDDRLQIRNVGTGAGQIGVSGSQVTLGGVVIGTFTGGVVDNSPLVVSLNANATPLATATLIRNITFRNVGDAPTSLPRTVEFELADGSGRFSEPVGRTVEVVSVNDAPLVTTSAGSGGYAENAPPVLIDPGIAISDVDSPDFNAGSLKVSVTTGKLSTDRLTIATEGTGPGQIDLDGTSVLYGGTVIGTYTGGYTSSGPLSITFNSSATPEGAQALARRIAFHNVGDNPTTTPRTITFVVSDGDGRNSLTATKQVLVSVSNDAPVITSTLNLARYTENALPVVILSSSSVVDLDSANFDGGVLTVDFQSGGDTLDRLRLRNVGTGPGQIGLSGNVISFAGVTIGTVAGGFTDNSPLVATLNSSATLPAVTALVKAVTFDTVGDNPVAGVRTVRFRITDGDGGESLPATRGVEVVAVNDAPLVTTSAGSADYVENGSPVLIDPGIAISDADSPDLNAGSLKVSVTTGKLVTDRLTIVTQGTAPGQIDLDGTSVLYGGTVIGTYTGGYTSSGPLTVTFNSSATPEGAQALARRIAFHNVGDNPTTAPRTITFVVNDGDGKNSLTASRNVNVSDSNDAPQITNIGPDASHTEGGAATIVSNTATLVDPDSPNFGGGSLTVTLVEGATTLDQLAIRNTGVGANQIGIAGSDVTFGGVVIGSFTGGTQGTALQVSFNSSASVAAVQALLRSVTFQLTGNISANSSRRVRFSLSDGDGGLSPDVEKSILIVNLP